MRLFDHQPKRVLAIYAHPDDADVAAGGTLAKWAAHGAEVLLVIGCDGSKGSHDPAVTGSAIAERRARELDSAAALLGVHVVRSLGLRDGEVANTPALRATLVGLVREWRPEVVLCPDPTAFFFGSVYWNHVDHRELAMATLDAVAPASAMPLYFPEAGPAHAVAMVLMTGTHEPSVTVDIDGYVETKVRAVLAHGSQIGDDAESVRRVVTDRAHQAGRDVGIAYGEPFRSFAPAL
jgi:LmbE family N-acetylglucosaminyl deacetylase